MTSMLAAFAAAAAEGGSKGGLTDFNSTLFVATLVLFAIFAFVLGKFGWKPLLAMVEEREGFVRNAVEGAEKANAEAQSLLEKHKEMLREAGREREEIMKRALQDAEALKADLAAKARAESESIVAARPGADRAREEPRHPGTARPGRRPRRRSRVADRQVLDDPRRPDASWSRIS